jgi:hypothetical protein
LASQINDVRFVHEHPYHLHPLLKVYSSSVRKTPYIIYKPGKASSRHQIREERNWTIGSYPNTEPTCMHDLLPHSRAQLLAQLRTGYSWLASYRKGKGYIWDNNKREWGGGGSQLSCNMVFQLFSNALEVFIFSTNSDAILAILAILGRLYVAKVTGKSDYVEV